MKNKHKIGFLLIVGIGILALISLFISEPIAQNTAYHSFADQRTMLGVQNFWNVLSNLPFLFVGLFPILDMVKRKIKNGQLFVFFVGVTLVSVGSGYYHIEPNNNTLVWDRLPMTIAFMGLFSFVISEYLNQKAGKLLLVPLLIFGFASIIYWVMYDDLRVYAFVQFFPIIVIPVILIFFSKANNANKAFWLLLVFYIFAKFFEFYDLQSFDVLKIMSGHSLKHLFAAIGIYLFYNYYSSGLPKPVLKL